MNLLAIRALAVLLLAASGAAAQGNTQPSAPGQPGKPPGESPSGATVRVDVTLARHRGEKRISSLPYTLFINPVGTRTLAQVRMGAEIPISTMTPHVAAGDGTRSVAPAQGLSYERIGTEIDCVVRPVGDGRYSVELTISDKTVYSDDDAPRLAATGMTPTLRTFRSYNTFVLKDGQTTQFPAAADRITGEIVRVEVTMSVVK